MAAVHSAVMDKSSLLRSAPDHTTAMHLSTSSNTSLQHTAVSKIRSANLNLDTFSPVNQNGSFEFDRVLKSGYVQKRTRKTKNWKPIYLVLRPNLLSIYKDDNEAKLRHKILLSELTAVAFLKDPKHKRHNVFGLFSPSRNYHLQATSKQDTEEWVQLIRKEARIEEEEEEMLLASPAGNLKGSFRGLEQEIQKQKNERQTQEERLASSSPEPAEPLPRLYKTRSSMGMGERRPSHTFEYSGNEPGSHSEGSEGETHPQKEDIKASTFGQPSRANILDSKRPMGPGRNVSQLSGINVEQDQERVVWQGHLLYLRSKSGVRQWKDPWAVLRPKNFALYKDEGEYLLQLIIPLSSIINVVEIDPISRTKTHCMQIITEEKSYRFCAHNEQSLDKTLGAFKSLLAKRKENGGTRPAGVR